MALRTAPAREQQLDALYSENEGPGIRAYVFGRLNKGHEVKAIRDYLAEQHGIDVPLKTFYAWLARWRREAKAAREAKEAQPRRRGRSAQTEEAPKEVTA